MISLVETPITVQPVDCFDEYVTQFSADYQGGSVSIAETEKSVSLALQNDELTADQALWLHDHQRSWQINVER